MLENILKIENKYDVFIFDLCGVIWNGAAIESQAEETLKTLKSKGKEIILLSNAPVRGFRAEESYKERGIIKGTHYDSLITSGDLAYDYFSHDKNEYKFYTIGMKNPELFKDSKYKETNNLKEADFVYIGIPRIFENGNWEDVTSIEPFEEELKKIYKSNKTLICVNPDLKAYGNHHQKMIITEGSLALYYENLGGEVEYIGKPYPEVYDFALKDCDVDDSRILMIGDTLETDILGANSYGIKSALVSTGISNDNMLEEGLYDIKEYARALDIIPTHFL